MTTKRPVGRPPSGLPKRVRRNINIQRTEEFDFQLLFIQAVIGKQKGLGRIASQTEAIREAVSFYAKAQVK